jgi:hypothetical protein
MITKGEDNWTMYFRRASALRKLGDYEDTLDCIDRAIASLPMGHTEVYQEQIRERELITISWGHAQHLSTVDEKLRSDFMHQVEAASEDLTRQVEAASQELAAQADADRADLQRRFNEAQRTVSDSLLKIIEILGLFVALAAFLLGSGAIVLDAGDFSERLGSMALVVVGSLVFFLLLRLTTTYRRR